MGGDFLAADRRCGRNVTIRRRPNSLLHSDLLLKRARGLRGKLLLDSIHVPNAQDEGALLYSIHIEFCGQCRFYEWSS